MSNEEQPVALVTECDGEHAKFYPQPAPAPQAAEALRSLVEIIDAAGLLNLSNGVQLGQVSWYVKALGCMDAARAALAAPQAAEARDERALFEAWSKREHGSLRRDPVLDYFYTDVRAAWRAWQARAALAAAPEPERIDLSSAEVAALSIPAGALAAPQAERKPLTDEQMAEALEALPKVGEKESCWVAVRGSTLRALLNAHGIGAQQEPKA